MSKIFSTALFVSCAAAQLTTSVWMPGTGGDDVSYEASVIKVNDDRTTLSLSVKGLEGATEMIDSLAQTITVAGNTYYAFDGVVAEQGISITVHGECSRQNTDDKSATCSVSSTGLAEAISSMCSEAGASQEDCGGADMETSLSTTLPEGYFGMGQIVVTAGEDLLPSASAAATPSAGSASATASPSASGASKSDKPTASGSESAANSGASKTSAPTDQSTNAAPLMTMAPALAGLGAAAAAFFL